MPRGMIEIVRRDRVTRCNGPLAIQFLKIGPFATCPTSRTGGPKGAQIMHPHSRKMILGGLALAGLATALAVTPGIATAAPALLAQAGSGAPGAGGAEEQVYGSQIMTPEERRQHRDRMRSATSAEERERIRREHHDRMQARARERGVTLPEEPPARGMGRGTGGPGMGAGPGMGRGMGGPGGPGMGGGMGSGRGMGPGGGQ